ncbi:hypothetical protein ACS0TY_019370 [Phlomoides rotata]
MTGPGTKAESEDLWSWYDLEYRACEDDAWYDVYVVLDATAEKLTVKYWSSSEYEILFTVAEFATEAQVDDLAGRFRPVSMKLEDNECGMLSIRTAVCATHAIGDDLYRFYDAVIEAVKISGGGRCNVTNGHCSDNVVLAGKYPRGNIDLRGSFSNMHGPIETMSWFLDHGVELKTEMDGRVFPASGSSSTIIECLLSEARKRGVIVQTGKTVTSVSTTADGKFTIKVEKRTVDFVEFVEADYLMIASGSSEQGYKLAAQLGHSIVKSVPSLFTFKIDDFQLVELSGVTFPKVRAKLKLETILKSKPEHTQVGPMLVTHWGFSGPVILRLSAWGARDLSNTDYKGIPEYHAESTLVTFILCWGGTEYMMSIHSDTCNIHPNSDA